MNNKLWGNSVQVHSDDHPNAPSSEGPILLPAYAPSQSVLVDDLPAHNHIPEFVPVCLGSFSPCGSLSES